MTKSTIHLQVNHAGGYCDDADWIWLDGRTAVKNIYVAFRLRVRLAQSPATPVMARLSASSLYLFYVNGRFVGRGPVRAWPGHIGLDTYDIGAHLRAGDNTLCALVHYYGERVGSGQVSRPGFLMQGGVGQLSFSTGVAGWACCHLKGWAQESPRISAYQGFNEWLDMAAYEPAIWQQGNSKAPLQPPWIIADAVNYWPQMERRAIPALRETPVPTAPRLLAIGEFDRPIQADSAQFEWMGDRRRRLPADGRIAVNGNDGPIQIQPGAPVGLILDFGRIVSGVLELSLKGGGGEEVAIGYADRLWLQGRTFQPARDPLDADPRRNLDLELKPNFGGKPECGGGVSVDQLRLRSGQNIWRGHFNLRGFRFIELNLSKIEGPLEINAVRAADVAYPVENRGQFRCSDPALNAIYEASRQTAALCMADTFMDNPSRERQQYGGDGRLQALYAYLFFGETRLARQFLYKFAGGLGDNGAIQSGGPWPWNQIIPAWTLHWIEAIREYVDFTDDAGVVTDLAGTMVTALAWFRQFIGSDGLLTVPEVFAWQEQDQPNRPPETRWNFIDWQRGGKQLTGEPARLVLNCIYYAALETAAGLMERTGKGALANQYRVDRKELGRYLSDALASNPAAASEHVRVYAALVELNKGEMPRVAAAIGRGRMESDFAFLWFTLAALEREAQPETILQAIRAVAEPVLAMGYTTFPETLDAMEQPSRALCQGVGACLGYFLPRLIAGIRPSTQRERRVQLQPWLGNLEWAEAVVPVADGAIAATVRKRGEETNITITAPQGWEVEVIPPPDGQPKTHLVISQNLSV